MLYRPFPLPQVKLLSNNLGKLGCALYSGGLTKLEFKLDLHASNSQNKVFTQANFPLVWAQNILKNQKENT